MSFYDPLNGTQFMTEVTKRLKGIAQIIGQAQQPATIKRSGEEVGWMAKVEDPV
jgi:hypothetical protein